jgi:7,8-dihydropterin-6-yl-methyl-4-(beta-D-ribofuranosyl)aminobenzene 5'-phosphate synthase
VDPKVTVLCENSVFDSIGALAEHGWAAWIETRSGNYLFDTGYKTLLHNASFLGVDLTSADAILISHHHIDHTGGLLDAVGAITKEPNRDRVDVYGHQDLFKVSYSIDPGRDAEYIGIPHRRMALESAGANFRLARGWRQIADGIHLTGQIPRLTNFEADDGSLVYHNERGELVTDPVMDDQSMVIETARGLFVILGCSHGGIINTLNYIDKKMGHDCFDTIIGGTHLGYAGEEQLGRTIEALLALPIGKLGVSHCTGCHAARRLASAFGERFFSCSVGQQIPIH